MLSVCVAPLGIEPTTSALLVLFLMWMTLRFWKQSEKERKEKMEGEERRGRRVKEERGKRIGGRLMGDGG